MDPAKIYFRELKSEEFRVAVLLPGRQNDPLKCRLVTVPIGDGAGPYEALSYEWGDPSTAQTITLDEEPFIIRQNLWTALVHLRSEKTERTLWIDAICINQDDTRERNHQVGLMKNIYGQATLVRVWLGTATPNSSKAFALLNKLWQNYNLVPGRLTQGGAKAWGALAHLCRRNYWSRIWIVQEYVLAQKVTLHCGSDCLEGVIFEQLLVKIKQFCNVRNLSLDDAQVQINRLQQFEEDELPSIWNQGSKPRKVTNEVRSSLSFFGVNSLERFKAFKAKTGTKDVQHSQHAVATSPALKISEMRLEASSRSQPLLGLLQACEDSQSSEPRDKIYALLGLATDIPANSVVVDYSRPIFKVKMDVVWFFQNRPDCAAFDMPSICHLVDHLFGTNDDEID